eukprot:4936541-Amphidinium_carterae.1
MESWVGTRRSLRAPPNEIPQLRTTAPWCVELPSSTQNASKMLLASLQFSPSCWVLGLFV